MKDIATWVVLLVVGAPIVIALWCVALMVLRDLLDDLRRW